MLAAIALCALSFVLFSSIAAEQAKSQDLMDKINAALHKKSKASRTPCSSEPNAANPCKPTTSASVSKLSKVEQELMRLEIDSGIIKKRISDDVSQDGGFPVSNNSNRRAGCIRDPWGE
jgi:hypothetical protein